MNDIIVTHKLKTELASTTVYLHQYIYHITNTEQENVIIQKQNRTNNEYKPI
jgi:hypothetical protein